LGATIGLFPEGKSAQEFRNSRGARHKKIPAGAFWTGSSEASAGLPEIESESPRHEATIGRAYYMSVFAATRKDWQGVMGHDNSRKKDPKFPVERVTHAEIAIFLGDSAKRAPEDASFTRPRRPHLKASRRAHEPKSARAWLFPRNIPRKDARRQ
jgi:hypothetical protein